MLLIEIGDPFDVAVTRTDDLDALWSLESKKMGRKLQDGPRIQL